MKKPVIFNGLVLLSTVVFGSSSYAFTPEEIDIYSSVVDSILDTSYGEYATYSEVNFNNDDVSELIISHLDDDEISTIDEVFTITQGVCVPAGSFYGPNSYFDTESGEGIYAVNTYQGYGLKQEIHMYDNAVSSTTVQEGEIVDWSEFSNDNPVYKNNLTNFYDEQILPESDVRYLYDEDVEYLDDTGLELAKNEIYARHGRIFVTPYIDKYFRNQSWYEPTVSPEEFSDSVFNEYESANIALIVSKEDQSGDTQYEGPQDEVLQDVRLFTQDELKELALLYYLDGGTDSTISAHVMEEGDGMVGIAIMPPSPEPDGTAPTPYAYYYVGKSHGKRDRRPERRPHFRHQRQPGRRVSGLPDARGRACVRNAARHPGPAERKGL